MYIVLSILFIIFSILLYNKFVFVDLINKIYKDKSHARNQQLTRLTANRFKLCVLSMLQFIGLSMLSINITIVAIGVSILCIISIKYRRRVIPIFRDLKEALKKMWSN
jgi:uncharacterized membrane protein